MDIVDLHNRALEEFGVRVAAVEDKQWAAPTPCTDWDVRALVNHVTGEALWLPPLMEGATIEEVGDRFDGDVLGEDPHARWRSAAAAAAAAVADDGAMERTVHLSFGDFPGRFYAEQLFADYLVHAWDLARAVGADEQLDAELVGACALWFDGMEHLYRDGGAVGPPVDVPGDADEQTRLLARFGRKA